MQRNKIQKMINLKFLEKNKKKFRLVYLLAKPFLYLGIDTVCDKEKPEAMYNAIQELSNKSLACTFANNKFEKSSYKGLGTLYKKIQLPPFTTLP